MVAFLVVLSALPLQAQDFSYRPAGELEQPGGDTFSLDGHRGETEYFPGVRFPLEAAPAFLNSQIYGHGGYMGPGGSQCDEENFRYPWADNYCEPRRWDMPFCPAGTGHQGQDIRAATCEDDKFWVVAPEAGKISSIGVYTVSLTTPSGRRYRLMHMDMKALSVKEDEQVEKGQRLGRVSDDFGDASTTQHLHFDVRESFDEVGAVFVPTYMSLVRAYERLIDANEESELAATFVGQTFSVSKRVRLAPGASLTGHVELRNEGTLAWQPGEIFLATALPRGGTSPVAAGDWLSAHTPATLDEKVEPGESGFFEFSFMGPTELGDYEVFFAPVERLGGNERYFADVSGMPTEMSLHFIVNVCDCQSNSDSGYGCRASSFSDWMSLIFVVAVVLLLRRRKLTTLRER